MIEIPDVNVLVALHVVSHQFHREAAQWLSDVAEFATTPITEAGFVRLMLQPRVAGIQVTPAEIAAALTQLKAQPHAVFVPDTEPLDSSDFWYALSGPNQVTDLHLLDLAKARNGVLVSFDHKLKAALRPRDHKYLKVLGR